jgi:very-short-patch-repair endonuclease
MRNSKAYNSLPYNSDLRSRAKELRKSGNLSEVLLWQQIKNKKFKGYDFDRQKIIGNFIVDFYSGDCGLTTPPLRGTPPREGNLLTISACS